MTEVESTISFAELEDRGIYEIQSRNLLRGAYVKHQGVFIGVRLKFGSRYLAGEVINDPPGRGTVTRVMEKLGEVPDGMEINTGNDQLYQLLVGLEEPSVTCSDCGMTSYNPQDIHAGYCGHCHNFTRGRDPAGRHLDV